MPKFTERTDAKCHLTGDSVPERVQSLSHATNCPIIDPDSLFFRKEAGQFHVPALTNKNVNHRWMILTLNHVVYYLEQMDGSLAAYAHLHRNGESVGCLYLGCVHSESWTASPKEK